MPYISLSLLCFLLLCFPFLSSPKCVFDCKRKRSSIQLQKPNRRLTDQGGCSAIRKLSKFEPMLALYRFSPAKQGWHSMCNDMFLVLFEATNLIKGGTRYAIASD
jgi:hypothetical protein